MIASYNNEILHLQMSCYPFFSWISNKIKIIRNVKVCSWFIGF